MRAVLTHLTRMGAGRICIAGQDASTREAVRPVLARGSIPRALLREEGGPLHLGGEFDFGVAFSRPAPPEVEDVVCDVANAGYLRTLSPSDFRTLLHSCARPRLREIFGPALAPQYSTAACPKGQGNASLGIYTPQGRVEIETAWGKAKLRFTDPELGMLSVRITDYRCYQPDHRSLDDGYLTQLQEALADQSPILSVGLSRADVPEDAPQHWLQVNNIHVL